MHKGGDEVRIYTRALHQVTPRVPEVAAATRALPASSLIPEPEADTLFFAGGEACDFDGHDGAVHGAITS